MGNVGLWKCPCKKTLAELWLIALWLALRFRLVGNAFRYARQCVDGGDFRFSIDVRVIVSRCVYEQCNMNPLGCQSAIRRFFVPQKPNWVLAKIDSCLYNNAHVRSAHIERVINKETRRSGYSQ